MPSPYTEIPSNIIAMLKADCEASGFVKRAAVTTCSPLEIEQKFVIALELEHPFLFDKLAESLSQRVLKSVDASKDIPLRFEKWNPNIQRWVINTPKSVFYQRPL